MLGSKRLSFMSQVTKDLTAMSLHHVSIPTYYGRWKPRQLKFWTWINWPMERSSKCWMTGRGNRPNQTVKSFTFELTTLFCRCHRMLNCSKLQTFNIWITPDWTWWNPDGVICWRSDYADKRWWLEEGMMWNFKCFKSLCTYAAPLQIIIFLLKRDHDHIISGW